MKFAEIWYFDTGQGFVVIEHKQEQFVLPMSKNEMDELDRIETEVGESK